MYTFYTCDGYKPIAFAAYDTPIREVIARCADLETERNDGFAVIAMVQGEIVATAEGVSTSEPLDRAYQAGYAHACGYHD